MIPGWDLNLPNLKSCLQKTSHPHRMCICVLVYSLQVSVCDKLQPGGPLLGSYLPDRRYPCVATAPAVTPRGPTAELSPWLLEASIRSTRLRFRLSERNRFLYIDRAADLTLLIFEGLSSLENLVGVRATSMKTKILSHPSSENKTNERSSATNHKNSISSHQKHPETEGQTLVSKSN